MVSYFIICWGGSIFSEFIYQTSKIISENGVHIEVLLPAFILEMVMKTNHNESKSDHSAANMISYIFMFLVGISMPVFMGQIHTVSVSDAGVVMPDLSWGEIAIHVVVVSMLSNLGKMVPMLYYRERSLANASCVVDWYVTRGEVGAGVIFIAIGYNIGRPLLVFRYDHCITTSF